MKRFYLLLISLITIAISGNAKDKVTTLWEDDYTSAIELNSETVGTFVEGDVLRVYLTLTAASNFGISYKSAANGWSDTAIPSINNMWPWISTTGDTYYDVTLTSADITALSGQNIYIQKGDESSITKVSLIHTLIPASTTNISTDEYASDWDGKSFAAVESAKIGDVLKFTYTATGTWFQIYVMNYGKGEDFKTDAYSVTDGEEGSFEYIIPDYTTLKKIRTEGFSVKGADFNLTSVDLLTYSDSYGYTTFTIGDTSYATWSSTQKYDFASAGLTAYYASSVTTGAVTLTSMDITWDYQGYIIKGAKGNYDVLESLTTDGSYYPSTNYLKYNISTTTIAASIPGTYHYIFAMDETLGIGFYRLIADHTLGANKAYLETTSDITPAANGRVTLVFEDETTDISGVKDLDATADGTYYTLGGARVKQPMKGLYIKDGKKIIVR